MSNTDQLIEEVEVTIAQAKTMIAKSEALQRLQSNKDFQLIINQGYLKDEAVRSVHLLSHPDMNVAYRERIIRDIDAIGSLLQHFRAISGQADQALADIVGAEEAREEILSEDGAE